MKRYLELLTLVLVGCGLLGCNEAPEIRQYRIAKERSDLGDLGQEVVAPTKQTTRMVVAIAERPSATWFFKITGPVEAVTTAESGWKSILESTQFDTENQPTWTLPAGWRRGPDRQMRLATLLHRVENQGDVEMAISRLGPNQNRLDNVNRWRGQLGLPQIPPDRLNLKTLKAKDSEFELFDEVGTMGASGRSMLPAPMKTNESPEFTHETPSGWTAGPTDNMVKVRLRQSDSEQGASITVTPLPASANTWLLNAQRWARQVNLDQSEEFITARTAPIKVSGIDGQQIRLIPDDAEQDAALVGVMLVHRDSAWFFKLMGTPQSVAASEDDFQEFLDSFQFQ